MPADVFPEELLAELTALDTPTVCNALELLDPSRFTIGFTTESLNCLYPALKPMVGYARTATFRSMQPLNLPQTEKSARTMAYYTYIAEGGPAPSVCVIQDLDGPRAGFGALWGEVNTHIHQGFGCLGVVTDGSVRDVDGNAPGFQMLCSKVVPSHAHYHIVDFGRPVNVAGMYVEDGDLVHADRHGAVVIPRAHAAEIPKTAALLAKREAAIIAATRTPGFNIEMLKNAVGNARHIH